MTTPKHDNGHDPDLKAYEKAGIEAAQAQNPPTDVEHVSGKEAEIRATFKAKYHEKGAEHGQQILEAQTRQDQIRNKVIGKFFREGIVQSVKTRIKSLLVDVRETLFDLFRTEITTNGYYLGFKRLNGLARDAFVPRSLKLFYAVLALMIVVEAVGQSTFFVDTMGWIPAVQLAIVFSAMNVLIAALLVAEGVRYVFHRNPVLKLIGLTVLIVFLVSFFLGHLILANYRMALAEKDVSQAAMKAIEYFRNHPFNLDINSWTLMIVGYLFAITSLLSGLFKTKDIYPGFTAYFQRKEEAGKARKQLVKDILHDIRKIVSDTIASTEKYLEELNQFVNDFSSAATSKAKIILIDEFLKQEINNDYQASVNAFRTPLYEGATHNLPEYMRVPPSPLELSGLDKLLESIKDDDTGLKELDLILLQHQEDVKQCILELDAIKNKVMNGDMGIEQFVADIHHMAKNRTVFADGKVPPFPSVLDDALKVLK